jgi:hypothetical protein
LLKKSAIICARKTKQTCPYEQEICTWQVTEVTPPRRAASHVAMSNSPPPHYFEKKEENKRHLAWGLNANSLLILTSQTSVSQSGMSLIRMHHLTVGYREGTVVVLRSNASISFPVRHISPKGHRRLKQKELNKHSDTSGFFVVFPNPLFTIHIIISTPGLKTAPEGMSTRRAPPCSS